MDTGALVVIALVAIALAVLATVAKRFLARTVSKEATPLLPYKSAQRILSPTELSFFRAINTLEMRAIICPKVRLADILTVDLPSASHSAWRIAFNQIAAKHVDFLFVDPDTAKPLLVIELDDRSHDRAKTVKRDSFVNAALVKARIPFVRYRARRTYSPADIRTAIDEAFARSASPDPTDAFLE